MTLVTGQHYKTEEPVVLSGIDMLMGATQGKSAGVPHPLVIGTLIFGIYGMASALFMPDKFIHSIISSLFMAVCIAMLRFDITFQAKAEFALNADALSFGAGWYVGLVLAVLNIGVVI